MLTIDTTNKSLLADLASQANTLEVRVQNSKITLHRQPGKDGTAVFGMAPAPAQVSTPNFPAATQGKAPSKGKGDADEQC